MRSFTLCVCAAWAACGPVLSAHADRDAVQQTLARMEQAVLAADESAYLACVDAADPVFLKEQQNWAKDLKRKPVPSFDLAIGEPSKDRPESFEADRATFELVMSWSLPPSSPDGKPIERTCSFPANFVRDAKSDTWVFAGEAWETLERDAPPDTADNAATDADPSVPSKASTPSADRLVRDVHPQPQPAPSRSAGHKVRIRYFPGYEQVAGRIADVLPSVRDRVDRGFGVSIDRVQEVKLYPSMRHLQQSIYLSYTDGLSGWNEPGESIKLLVRPSASADSMRALLAHEYAHVATFELGDKSTNMPWWILEGVADLAAEIYVGSGHGVDAESAAISWHEKDQLAPWQDLADFHTVPGKLHRHVYKQGHHMLGFVSDRFGASGRNAWLRHLSQGSSLNEATAQALQVSFDELDRQWRDELTKRAAARKLERDQKRKQKELENAAPQDAPTQGSKE